MAKHTRLKTVLSRLKTFKRFSLKNNTIKENERNTGVQRPYFLTAVFGKECAVNEQQKEKEHQSACRGYSAI